MGKVPAEELEWSLAPNSEACPDCPLIKNPPKGGFAEAERIIHHILWQYQMPDQTALDGRRGLL